MKVLFISTSAAATISKDARKEKIKRLGLAIKAKASLIDKTVLKLRAAKASPRVLKTTVAKLTTLIKKRRESLAKAKKDLKAHQSAGKKEGWYKARAVSAKK